MSVQTSKYQPSATLTQRPVRILVVRDQRAGGSLEPILNHLSSLANLELHIVESGLSRAPVIDSPTIVSPSYDLTARREDLRSAQSRSARALWFKCGPGNIHERLVRYSARIDASLVIVQGSLGRTSWWRPSAAERLSFHVPVLSVAASTQPEFEISSRFRWLVVLDGSPYAEAALRPLRRIARWLPSEVTLVQPLEFAQLWARRVVSHQSVAMARLGVSIADAEDYLRRVSAQLGTGVPVRTCCLSERKSLSTVMRMIDSEAADGVAIGLSRQSKFLRRIEGEFNELIIGKLKKPYLLTTAGCNG